MSYLSERPTAQQWQVAAWMFIAALGAIGASSFWFCFRADAAHRDTAQQLIWLGVTSWTGAVVVWAIKRGVEWFVD